MVKQISLHAASNAERGAYGSKYSDNHLQDSFPNFLFHFLFSFLFFNGSTISFFSELSQVFPHTPCFTLIEQALSVFFNVNYI